MSRSGFTAFAEACEAPTNPTKPQKQNAPAGAGRCEFLSPMENRLLPAAVVLVAVDLARHTILLPVYLRFLLRSQFAAIGRAVVANFMVDLRFLILQIRSLARRQLPALDALRDAVLLVLSPPSNFAP